MKIILLESYFSGSHKSWAEGYKKNSIHEIEIISLTGSFWKWRMHGGAISISNKFKKYNIKPDLILFTDMIDITTFIALNKNKTASLPIAMYFHENQLTYPWSKKDRDIINKIDNHYAFINYVSALASDKVFFNSSFHMESLLSALPKYLNSFPDNKELETIINIKKKSEVLDLGIDLKVFDLYYQKKISSPVILWNHRWEYDKNPDDFFKAIRSLRKVTNRFQLVILGESFSNSPNIFIKAKKEFEQHILHWGYANDKKSYCEWLWKSNIIPVTSNQEFFGASVMEAIYCGNYPILPNRLTYPELLPLNMYKDNIYDSITDLTKKLIVTVQRLNNNELLPDLSKIATKYDWSEIAPIYDKKFSNMV